MHYLDVIVAIVVQVEGAEELRIDGHVNVIGIDYPFGKQLAAVLLHLDVVKLPVAHANHTR